MVAQIEPLNESAGGGVWLLAIVSALALLLSPETAVAQSDTTPPSIVRTSAFNSSGSGWVVIVFNENVDVTGTFSAYSVTYDGVPQDILSVTRVAGGDAPRSVAIKLASIPDGAVVVMSFVQPADPNDRLRGTSSNVAVKNFKWDVTANRQLPTVYDALGAYFSGEETLFGETVTLRFVNSVLQQADGQSYHEALLEKVDAGQLDEVVPGPQSAWGDPGTEDWAQMGQGFPRCVYDAEGNCIDMSETWGERYMCGNKPQPGLADNDFGDFFWACNSDNQWVPVRRPKPGVDYAHDHQLIRPGQPGYDDKCLYVRRHPDGHPQAGQPELDENGHRIPEPASRYNGDGTWTTIRGANYDPIDGSCRGRG